MGSNLTNELPLARIIVRSIHKTDQLTVDQKQAPLDKNDGQGDLIL